MWFPSIMLIAEICVALIMYLYWRVYLREESPSFAIVPATFAQQGHRSESSTKAVHPVGAKGHLDAMVRACDGAAGSSAGGSWKIERLSYAQNDAKTQICSDLE